MKFVQSIFLLAIVLTIVGCRADENDDDFQRYVGTQRFGIGQVTSQIVIVIRQEGNSITGGVTPPGQAVVEPFSNGHIDGTMMEFDRKEAAITYRYRATLQGPQLEGTFQPLGCIQPSSGEPCLTDSNGSFTAIREGVL